MWLDLMPTMLGLLGLPVPTTCQGEDRSRAILSGIDDGADSQPLFMNADRETWRGVYTRAYTYAVGGFDDAPQRHRLAEYDTLYAHAGDPWGRRDLFHDPAWAEVRRELHALTLSWLDRFGDPFADSETLLRLTTGMPRMADSQQQSVERMTASLCNAITERGNGSGGSCFGDSGGPVFRKGTNTIGAIVSWGITPCIGVDYQFRMDTANALDFVEAYLD